MRSTLRSLVFTASMMALTAVASSAQITIELPTTPQKKTSVTIYNLNGQQLITRQITESQTVVDVSGLPSGVYFVKVKDDEKVMVQKVIKQ